MSPSRLLRCRVRKNSHDPISVLPPRRSQQITHGYVEDRGLNECITHKAWVTSEDTNLDIITLNPGIPPPTTICKMALSGGDLVLAVQRTTGDERR